MWKSFWSKMSDKRIVLMILGRWKKKDRRQDKVWLTVLETSLFALCPIADLFSAFLLAENIKWSGNGRAYTVCSQPDTLDSEKVLSNACRGRGSGPFSAAQFTTPACRISALMLLYHLLYQL